MPRQNTSGFGFTFSTVPEDSPGFTGDLHVVRDETLIIEWKIHNFLSLLGDVSKNCISPSFTFSSCSWCMELHPHDDNKEWIPLYLCSTNCNPFQIVAFELGIKKDDDKYYLQQTFIRKFREKSKYGIRYFLRRSELAEKKDELSTSDSLTVTCKLKKCVSPIDKNKEFAPGMMDLLVSNKHSDLNITVKDQVFPAHKVILAASSKVFSAMFDHEMSEKNSGVLNIQDCEPKTFKNFLRFLYVGRTDITDSNVYQLYSVGHKYCVNELIASCVDFMLRNISVDNICDVATLGELYFDIDVFFFCSEFFEENIQKILPSPNWKSLMKDNFLVAYKLLENVASRITVEKCSCGNHHIL